MKNKIFAGIVLITIGIIFLLKQLGILTFSVWQGFSTYWPVGIILVGLALMFRKKGLAFLFLFITIVLGVIYGHGNIIEIGESREIIKEISIEDNITTIDLNVGFGAGDLVIKNGNNNLIRHYVKTSDINDPIINIEKTGNKKKISLERHSPGFQFWDRIKDEWEIELPSNVLIDLNLDYGATNAEFHLENLKVNNLNIDSGAASTTVFFGKFPSKVDINTGASTIDLKFIKGTSIVIDIDGGVISTNLDGFVKKNSKYYSENYDENKESIEIKIDAGATTIKGGFY